MAWDDYEDREAAESFKKARLNGGVSLEALSEHTGIPVLQIQNIEMASHSPSNEEWKLLRDGLKTLGVHLSRRWRPLREVAGYVGRSEQTLKRWGSQSKIDILKTSEGLFVDFYQVSNFSVEIYMARRERAKNLGAHKKS